MQRLSDRFLSFVAAAVIATGLALAAPASLRATEGAFADFSGSWNGTGTLRPSGGQAERIRCSANYRQRGSSQNEIDLQLKCDSDTYKFDLVGQFAADESSQITGRWTERTRNVGGTAVGNAAGERIQLHIESSGFAATFVMSTRNKRQSVTIDSQGGGQVVKAAITLSRG